MQQRLNPLRPWAGLTPMSIFRFTKAEFGRVVLKTYKHKPCYALTRRWTDLDLLGYLLQATTNIEIRSPDLKLYCYVLEFECDPNTRIVGWPQNWHSRHPLSSDDMDLILNWCARITW